METYTISSLDSLILAPPNTRKYSLHCYTVPLGHTFPSSALPGVQKGFISPLDLSMRFLSSLGLSTNYGHLPLLSLQTKIGMLITTNHKETRQHRLHYVTRKQQGSLAYHNVT